ncbi:hypothetical protein F4813DRAFT_302559 [Daldinia decipiens]|uniref:uncharacterized protein n=1 Tax=Daldinia decipiens TaxID=326647 RepID=UPI0020C2C88A|nr:uncharacterized protein F4813DRAFT_302559 [Daldinia decipiens]KAI1652702.1 hypothetical protein F4813DRAFT_302559 [Daldinia decipiens]
MQFSTLLLTTALSSLAMANYNIMLYQKKDCKKAIGQTCSNVAARTCCGGGGNKYRSAKFAETAGGNDSDDQLKIYKESDCGGLAIKQQTGNKCLSNKKKEVEGAQVFVVINARDEQSAGPAKRVEPDEHFLEEGAFRYTLKRDSPEGEAYEMLARFEDQAEHLRSFGKREEIAASTE